MIREAIITKYVKGKDVLDVGGVGQNAQYDLWSEIKPWCKTLVGIDIVPSVHKGIVCGNMEHYSFGRQFDCVILGDVLEHVDNQGVFLDNIRAHLRPEGFLIITTPNAKWPTVFMPTNTTHTLWHDKSTLTHILQKHGFTIVDFKYYYGNKLTYNIVVRPLVARQAMLAVCQITKS